MNLSLRHISPLFFGTMLLCGSLKRPFKPTNLGKVPFHWGISGHPKAEYAGIGIPTVFV